MYKIPLSATPFNASDIAAMLGAYSDRPVMAVVEDFEKALQHYTGALYVVALNSGTSAIHLGLKALGVGPGDTVIAPTFTYVATVGPIVYQGATPVLIDCEEDTWNISPELLEKALKMYKPKCVIVVHNYGMPAKMREIIALCDRYGVPILEDAAEAIGSQYFGTLAGRLGKVGVFSFNNNKTVTAYGGGALVTESEEIYKKALFWASQSRENKPYYEHTDLGFNYRMGPLNAAAGLIELRKAHEKVEVRRATFRAYMGQLGAWGDARWLAEPEGLSSNRWLTTVVFGKELIVNDILEFARVNGIECRRLWNPMHLQPFYKHYPSLLNGNSERLFDRGLCLPSGGTDIVGEVADVLKRSETGYLS